jgi:hypothetical protein
MARSNKGEPRYQVPRELADSLAFRTLSNSAKVLWHDLMMQYRGNNNGNINATLSNLKYFGWRSSSTLSKALAELIAHGFLCETRKGGGNGCSLRQCCLYRFTHLVVNANDKIGIKGGAATYDYRQYDPQKLPKKITLTVLKKLANKNSSFGNQSVMLRKSKRHASENEVYENQTLRNSKHEKVEIIPKTAISKDVEVNL